MKPDGNIDLEETAKKNGNCKYISNFKRLFLFLSLNILSLWLFKVGIMTMYHGVYNVCGSIIYGKNRTEMKVNVNWSLHLQSSYTECKVG